MSATPAPPASGPTIQQQCSLTFGANRPTAVALGSITAYAPNTLPSIGLLDITDPLAAKQICTYQGLPWQARLIATTRLGYAVALTDSNPADTVIDTFDVLRATQETLVRVPNSGFGGATFALNADNLAYILATAPTASFGGAGSWELHLAHQGTDTILDTLPGVPARGGGPNDDLFLAFSPDGRYLALVETFTASRGATKYLGGELQVRRVIDGSLVAPRSTGDTMAVWVGDSLFYRDDAGVHRMEADGTARLVLPGVAWYRPHASPDGKWIVYATLDSTGLPHVNVYSVWAGSAFPISSGGRDGGVFLSPTVLWETEQRLCTANDPCGMIQYMPTGVTFTYDVGSRQETRSTITALTSVWPRMD